MVATGEVDFSSTTRVCAENRLRWDLSPEQIRQVSDELIANTKKMYDAVGSLDLDRVTFSNTLKALADMEAEYAVQKNMLGITKDVYPSAKLRATSRDAWEKLSKFNVDMSRRKNVYQRIVALGLKVDEDSLTVEDKRYMERWLRESTREIQSDLHSHNRKQNTCLKQKPCADSVLNTCKAKSAKNVSIFLDGLAHKLKPLGAKERTILLKLKMEECQKRCLPFNGELCMEDLEYYKAQVVKNQYGVDHDQLKEYFPLEVVTQGLLDICQDLLGLSFSLVHGAPVWHPDVTLYRITDRSSGQTFGQFYLDLFTRKGKDMEGRIGYCYMLQSGCLLSDGRRQIAVAAIVTKFSKPTANVPCLLEHDNVKTFFHEFGHAMHFLCAQVDYTVFSASNVEEDFSEVPSLMLGNWVWEKEPLQRISKHYKTGAPIPDDLLDKLVKSRLANISMDCLKKIVRAKLDQALHTQDLCTQDLAYTCKWLSKDILGVPAFQRPYKSINTICRYVKRVSDGTLYRYLWAEVLSMDMFYSRFKQEGIMNPKVGLDYRNCILKPGASKDTEEMLKNFLGRAPNQEAFLLGKTVSASKSTRICYENCLHWDLSPGQIRQMSDELIANTEKVYDAVGSLDLDRVTFNNTLKALADMEAEYAVQTKMLVFPRHVSPSAEVRAASRETWEKLSKFKVDMSRRKNVYQRILALESKVDEDSLTAEDKRYMERWRRESIREIQSDLHSHNTKQKPCADSLLKTSKAKSANNVSIFLDKLAHKLKPLGDKERTNLLKLKEDECQKRGLPFNGELYMEDMPYYKAQVLKNQYGVDHDQLKEYFPLEVVTQGLLDICQDLLGLSFSLVHCAPVWHPDVTLYCVTDHSSGQTVGQFYLDLFTRAGKDMGTSLGYCSLLQPGCLLSDGRRQMAVAAIVTEFSKPKGRRKRNNKMPDTPCLLKHQDVITFFHEFGHAMHGLCTQVNYAVFSAFSVKQYFVEAPSQMLENWVWEKEPLQRISKHYKTGAPIPDKLLDKLVNSRLANIGMDCLMQIVRAKLDLALHTQDLCTQDLANECMRLYEDILGIPALQIPSKSIKAICDHVKCVSDGIHGKLYRYLWGEVLSMDMFYSRFKQEGIMNPKVGLDYRNCILKPGASKDAEEMLKNFLGRAPNQKAFLLSKNVMASNVLFRHGCVS